MQLERDNTRRLLSRYVLIALLIPVLSGLGVVLYAQFFDHQFTNSDWKRVVLCIWLGTLSVLLKEALPNLSFRTSIRQNRPVLYEPAAPAEQRRARSISDWESKKSRGLLKELWIMSLLLPTAAVIFAALGAYLLGIELNGQAWKIIILIVWLGALASLVRRVRRMGSAGLIYDGESQRRSD